MTEADKKFTEKFQADHVRWLKDPHTVVVLEGIRNACLRPAIPNAQPGDANESSSSLALGEVAGAWKVYDFVRNLDTIGKVETTEILESTYTQTEEKPEAKGKS